MLLSNNFLVILVRSTVAIQHEDGRPWIHGILVERDGGSHSDKSYRVQLTKIKSIIIRNI